MPPVPSPPVAHAANDLDQEVTRQGLPPDIMPAYDGIGLVLENPTGRPRITNTIAGRGGISMIGLFFEVQTKPGHRDQYLDLAASLKPDLEAMGGCRFIDRFRSLTRENLLLSYQIWQDEGALTAWRAHAYHHDVQTSAARGSFRIIASASPRSFTKKGRDSRSGSPSGARPITIPQGASRPISSPRNRRMPRWRRRPNGAVMLSRASIVTSILRIWSICRTNKPASNSAGACLPIRRPSTSASSR